MDDFTVNDISAELWRVYIYNDGEALFINQPQTLYVKKSNTNSHRVVDKDGVTFYPRNDWIGIKWKQPDEVSF